MGKYRGKKGQAKVDTRQSTQDGTGDKYKIEKENKAFKDYYSSFPLIEDFEEFTKILQSPLPTAFRFSGSRATGRELLEYMKKTYFPVMEKVEIDGVPIELPFPLEWFPGGLGFQFNTQRGVIRKNKEIKDFQRFLVSETESGNISRQEAVSMIPPLLLDGLFGIY